MVLMSCFRHVSFVAKLNFTPRSIQTVIIQFHPKPFLIDFLLIFNVLSRVNRYELRCYFHISMKRRTKKRIEITVGRKKKGASFYVTRAEVGRVNETSPLRDKKLFIDTLRSAGETI